jgi:hypothetical protein
VFFGQLFLGYDSAFESWKFGDFEYEKIMAKSKLELRIMASEDFLFDFTHFNHL